MEILQVVAGPLAAGFLAQHLLPLVLLAAAVHFRQIGEEQPRAREQLRQRAVVVGRQRIDAGLDIGEVLREQAGHVGVEAAALGHRRVGAGLGTRALAAPARRLRQPPHHLAVADVPGHPRQLARAIGDAGGEAGDGTGHGLLLRDAAAAI